MSWGNRARLAGGLLGVLVVVMAATFHLNSSRGVVQSDAAQISAEVSTIATPYSGLVVDQLVKVGDTVTEGQAMFRLDSANLQRDVALGAVPQRTVETSVDAEGYLLVRATAAGTVTAVDVAPGTFVRESSELATVEQSGSLYVGADFVLSPEQYARLGAAPAAVIVLPGGREMSGEVTDVTVATQEGQARIVVTVRSAEMLAAQGTDRLVGDGVPVVVRLSLKNTGVVTDVADAVSGALSGVADRITGSSPTGSP